MNANNSIFTVDVGAGSTISHNKVMQTKRIAAIEPMVAPFKKRENLPEFLNDFMLRLRMTTKKNNGSNMPVLATTASIQ